MVMDDIGVNDNMLAEVLGKLDVTKVEFSDNIIDEDHDEVDLMEVVQAWDMIDNHKGEIG
jgi:hypothetical protein